MSHERFTAYISKYALTDGILERRVELVSDNMVQMLESRCPAFFHGEGKEWHRTRAGAVERAEVLRENKLRAIERQKDRIAALVFE